MGHRRNRKVGKTMKAILVVDIPKEYELDQLAVNYMLYSVDGRVLDGDMGIELKPMPTKEEIYEIIYQAYGNGNDETYQRIRQVVEDIYDEILGEEE